MASQYFRVCMDWFSEGGSFWQGRGGHLWEELESENALLGQEDELVLDLQQVASLAGCEPGGFYAEPITAVELGYLYDHAPRQLHRRRSLTRRLSIQRNADDSFQIVESHTAPVVGPF